MNNLDADLTNADWTKVAFTDEDEWQAWLDAQGMSAAEFRQLPVFKKLAAEGRIPEWMEE